jgi:hypothetical protein
MTPGAWVIVSVVIALVLSGGIYLFTRWLKGRIPWAVFASEFPNARAYSSVGIDVPRLVACLKKAQECLTAVWTPEQVSKVVSTIHIYVHPTEAWVDGLSGIKEAGASGGGDVIEVGLSMAALCHELAHACQGQLENVLDNAHGTWEAKGVWKALSAYDVWFSASTGWWVSPASTPGV